MTQAERNFRDNIALLVSKWTMILKVDHWQINIVWPEEYDAWPECDKGDWPAFDKGEEGELRWAAAHRSKDYETARLYFNADVLMRVPARHVESTVIHELLHLVTSEAEFVLDLIDRQLHRDVERVVSDTFIHNFEGVVDRLAWRFLELSEQLIVTPTEPASV